MITLANLFCGVLAVWCAAGGECCLMGGPLATATFFILLGIFFDFFDGMTARLLKVASPLGKELDSLADAVTSGVAPGMILFRVLENHPWEGLRFVAFLIPVFAAYRLAKFNLDERQHQSFLGLPAPANALLWAGIGLCFELNVPHTGYLFSDTGLVCLAAASLLTGVAMIGDLPMFSLKFDFKDMSWKTNKIRYWFLIGCVAIVAVSGWTSMHRLIIWYIVWSVLTQRNSVRNE